MLHGVREEIRSLVLTSEWDFAVISSLMKSRGERKVVLRQSFGSGTACTKTGRKESGGKRK